MSTLTTNRAAVLPRVNLLPEEIAEERRFRVIQGALAVAVAAALGVIGVLFLAASTAQSNAQEGLDNALAKQSELKREQARYAKVPLVYAQVQKAETQLVTAFGSEVLWSGHLLDVLDGTSDDLAVERIEIVHAVAEPLPPIVEGLEDGGAVIGRISLTGRMISRPGASRGPLGPPASASRPPSPALA